MNRIGKNLALLTVLALCRFELSAFAEEAWEAGGLQGYRVSMEEDGTVPVRWYWDTPSFPFMQLRKTLFTLSVFFQRSLFFRVFKSTCLRKSIVL